MTIQNGKPPNTPWSWYYGCSVRDVTRGPQRVVIGRRSFVIFRTSTGTLATLDGQCVHLGADLSLGCVVGDGLRCPYHEWTFAVDGRCVHIPASEIIPEFARQAAFPTEAVGGYVFFFNRPAATFNLPFFDGVLSDELLPARPFDLDCETDWSMIAANGFDLQHFRAAHDRTLLEEPTVDSPSPFARRICAKFAVTGSGWRDRLTRRVSGPHVTMTVTSWSGTMILVSAQFRRTTSYGMVCVTPVAPGRCRLRTIIWVKRSQTAIGRVIDPLDAAVRRSFIRAFMQDDYERSAGTRYTPASLIEADATLADYFTWLAATAQGEASRESKG